MRHRTPTPALLLLTLPGAARADNPFVDPFTASSAKGGWSLRVWPSSPQGAGPAAYTMTHDGVQIWSKDLPVTLRACVVSSSGAVAGYAYDNGYVGWGGALVVLALAPDGTVLRQASLPRDGPALAIDPPPPGNPRGEEVLLDEDGPTPPRALIRLTSRSDAVQLLPVSLTDDAALPEQTLTPPPLGEMSFARLISCQRIPGAGLCALHWYLYPKQAAFQITDRDGKAVWTRRIHDEYASMGNDWNWWSLGEEGFRQLETSPGALAITSYADGSRTPYSVIFRDGAWSVDPKAAAPAKPLATPPAGQPPAPTLTSATLRDAGTIKLGPDTSKPLIDDVSGLGFDDRGRIGWICRTDDRTARLTLVDRDGRPVADVPLPDRPTDSQGGPVAAVWLDADRWLVARTTYSKDGPSSDALFVDVKTGAATPLPDFKTGSVKRLARTEGGGFVVLASLSERYTMRDQLSRFDKDGRLLDSKTEPGYGQGDLISDVAVLSDGTTAVLIGVADASAVRLVPKDGGAPRTLQLMEILAAAKDPGMVYIADLRADKDGGFIVYDSAHNNHLHRISKDGRCWQSFHAQGPKGEPFRLYDAFAVDPDGRVWGSDHSRLYRFSDSGRADLALGGPPEGAMAEPVALTLDRQGHIYTLEKGTAAVHVFDPNGAPLRILRPEPGDTSTQDALAWIRVEADGTVRARMSYESPVVVFNPDGQRAGLEHDPDRGWRDVEPWRPVPGGGWEENGASLRRLSSKDALDGTPPVTITHRPDGPWLVNIVAAHAAPDGSLAVLCDRPIPGGWGFNRGPGYLCRFDPLGKGLGVLRLESHSPFQSLYFDGARILLADEQGLTAFDPALNPSAQRFSLPGEHDFWHILPRPDGSLAAWKHGARTLNLYTIPDGAATHTTPANP